MLFWDFLNVIIAIFAAFGLYSAINMLYDIIIVKIKLKKEGCIDKLDGNDPDEDTETEKENE